MAGRSVHERLTELMLRHNEKQSPLAFVGREGVLTLIEAATGILSPPYPRGQTFIIQGAPGAGKTALITEAAKRLDVDCIVRRGVPTDQGIQGLWNNIATTITGIPLDEIRAIQYKEKFGDAGVDAMFKGRGGHKSASTLEPVSITSCDEIRTLLDRSGKAAFKKPVVVCIDEIQTIQDDSAAASFVHDLHTQDVAPVLLVCSGLANSLDQLEQKARLTRPVSIHVIPLGALSTQETLAAAKQALRVIADAGVEGHTEVCRVLANRIAEAADNWPRHLTCYLQAVCEVLIAQPTPSFATIDIDQTLEKGHALRQSYYEERLASSQLPVDIIADLYSLVRNESPLRDECAGFLEERIERAEGRSATILHRRFPSGEDAFMQVLRTGLITAHRITDPCEIPIPSMESFIVERARREQARISKRQRKGAYKS